MDVKQIRYIIAIHDEKNISKAAEKLFISQSALDQQLLKLENELGTPLFYRSRGVFSPTDVGRIYVEYAKRILALKNEAYNRIHDTSDQKRGTLVLSFAPERGMNMFINIYPRFYREHPEIKTIPREVGVRDQLEMLQHDEVDIGFITHKDRKFPGLVCVPLMQEEFILITPKGQCVENCFSADDGLYPVITPEQTQDMLFCFIKKVSTQRDVIDPVFASHGIKPEIFLETDSNRANIALVRQGVCCSVVPHHYVRNDDNVVKYYLSDRPKWYVSVCYKDAHYLTNAAKAFIALASEYFRNCV